MTLKASSPSALLREVLIVGMEKAANAKSVKSKVVIYIYIYIYIYQTQKNDNNFQFAKHVLQTGNYCRFLRLISDLIGLRNFGYICIYCMIFVFSHFSLLTISLYFRVYLCK